ncbi:hypothetical protein [Streptomyces formicae]
MTTIDRDIAAPVAAERSASLVLNAEVMADLDDGRLTLIASTDPTQADLAEVTPDRLHELVAAAHAKLDDITRLANEYEARENLRAIIAEHGLELDEVDTVPGFHCFYGEFTNGKKVVAVPRGQDPITRLDEVVRLLHRQGYTS